MKIFLVLAVLVAVAYAQTGDHCGNDGDCAGFTCHGHNLEPYCEIHNGHMCGCRTTARRQADACHGDADCAGLNCPHNQSPACMHSAHSPNFCGCQ